jgi:hypothetical protein
MAEDIELSPIAAQVAGPGVQAPRRNKELVDLALSLFAGRTATFASPLCGGRLGWLRKVRRLRVLGHWVAAVMQVVAV